MAIGGRIRRTDGLPEAPTARERIVLAAVEILEKEGAAGITTRRIAELASVNSASVNYYFGSREKLLDYVMSATLEHGFRDWEAILGKRELDLPIRFFCVVSLMLEGVRRYPGLVRSHLVEAVTPSSSERFLRVFGGFLDKCADALASGPGMDGGDARIRCGQMLSAAVFAGLVPGMLPLLTTNVEQFAKSLVETFLGCEVALTPEASAAVADVVTEAFASFMA
jgi:AcrR family transcriptional regulator